ncbi:MULTISPECIES: hypothetical protein [unclassified Streptomyces]|nr:hypothetical protein OG758_09145 [Streptomyces sp. NBC_01474]
MRDRPGAGRKFRHVIGRTARSGRALLNAPGVDGRGQLSQAHPAADLCLRLKEVAAAALPCHGPCADSPGRAERPAPRARGFTSASRPTARQEAVLRVIRDVIANTGDAPTVREISQRVGLSSSDRSPTSSPTWRSSA